MLRLDPYPFDPNLPSMYEDTFGLNWQMTRWEKFAFIALLEKLRPAVAIEIGNAQGGSLQVLHQNCEKIYAVDYQQAVHDNMRQLFPTKVEYHTGDSRIIMPEVLKKIQANGEQLGFVFIDGNHSTEGVKADINSVLHHYTPVTDLVIIFHDSFNPVCRQGIIDADWHNNPYVHYVDIDYIPGNFYKDKFGACEAGSMWNGLSFALLKAEKRTGPLEVRQSGKNTFDAIYKASVYNSFKVKHYYPFKQAIKNIIRGKK